MESMKSEFIARSAAGELIGCRPDIEITSVSTDSRSISRGALFVPIKGESFDGHDFIEKAFEKGAALTLSSRKLPESMPHVRVGDTLASLHLIAGAYLKSINPSRICITGSTGKTTTKNLLASSLPAEGTVYTEGNTNNLIGVPQNVFRCGRDTKRAVLEMGMNTKGELSALSRMVRPTHVIITSVNNSHIGNFNSFDEIIMAKHEILDGYAGDGPVIICGDDERVLSAFSKTDSVTFGLHSSNAFKPDSMTLNRDSSEIRINGESFTVKIPGMGGVFSFLAVYAFMKTYPSMEADVKKGIEEFMEPQSRMNISVLGKITLIDDSYNASPVSMKNAIDVLSRFSSRRVALLSDMLELGRNEEELHSEIGEELKRKSIDVLIAVGRLSRRYLDAFTGEKHSFETREMMEEKLFSILNENDAVLVKGSHSTKMSETAKKIKEHYALRNS